MTQLKQPNISVVIADSQAVFRKGLQTIFQEMKGWEVVGETEDARAVISTIEHHTPDILILDFSMPNLDGIHLLSQVQKAKEPPAVLVISSKENRTHARTAIQAGAKGYLPKSTSTDELGFALQAVSKGQTYLSPAVTDGVLQENLSSEISPLLILTTREQEVFKLLAEGFPNREIAKILEISPRTIDTHRANIMKKLELQSNAEIAQMAVKYKIIS